MTGLWSQRDAQLGSSELPGTPEPCMAHGLSELARTEFSASELGALEVGSLKKSHFLIVVVYFIQCRPMVGNPSPFLPEPQLTRDEF